MKKIATLLLALIMVLAIASCGHKNEQQPIHKIGVIVYDLKDEQVQAFRQYMEGYLGKNFSDVDFLYSAGKFYKDGNFVHAGWIGSNQFFTGYFDGGIFL